MKHYRLASILTLASLAIFTYSVFWYLKSDSMATDTVKKMADAGFLTKDLAIEKVKVASLHREIEQLNHKLEHVSDSGFVLDGFFDTSVFTNASGLPAGAAFISKRSYLKFPGLVLIRLSDSEWSWMTNNLGGHLVTGTNAESETFVLTE